MSIPFFVITVYFLFVGGPFLPMLVISLVILAVSFLASRFYRTQPVQEAAFFESSFFIKGANLEKDILYGSIDNISLVKSPYFLRPHVRITLKEGEVVRIPWNPSNRSLRSDLVTWARSKMSEKGV